MDGRVAERLQHRQLMVTISQRLSDSDLSDLKYLCGDTVPELALEKVQVPTDLFTVLQHHGYLSAKQYKFLEGCLLSIGRHDLASVLPDSQEVPVYQKCTSAAVRQESVAVPPREWEFQHRIMLVSIAERLRAEDISKLAYITSGKVSSYGEVSSVTALQIITKFDSGSLCCGSYMSLSDLLLKIGRSDLSDLVSGFPRNVLPKFSAKNQAFHLMMEVLRSKRSVYTLHLEKLRSMKDGDDEIIQHIHSLLLGTGLKGLSIRSSPTSVSEVVKSLKSAFDSQYDFMQCTVEFQTLKYKPMFNFVNDSFGCDDCCVKGSYPCLVAESAHQARKFILEVSSEVIGKEKTVEINELNYKIERGINVCSKYAKHILSLLSSLSGLLSAVSNSEVDIKPFRKELADIFTCHQDYIASVFPSLDCSVDNLSVSLLNTSPWDIQFHGSIAMLAVPSYVILLNLIAVCNGHTISNLEEIFKRMVDFMCHSDHIVGSKEFIQKCAASLHENVACFGRDVIELDSLCAPLISELVCL